MRRLSRHWKAFRNRRRQQLLAEGCLLHVAAEFAAKEAAGRARFAQVVGDEVATAAPLELRETAGQRRFCLVGEWDDVPEEVRPALREFLTQRQAQAH